MWNKFIIWLQEFLFIESEYDSLYRKWAKEDFIEIERPKLKSTLDELQKL